MKSPKLHRILSLTLALCMLCTLLSGLSLTASADGTYTVTFSVPTGYLGPDPQSVPAGNSFNLPTGISAPEGYTFVGWYENALPNEISLVDPEDSIRTGLYMPARDITLYACYTRTETIPGYYQKTTGEPASASNKYLIVYESADLNVAYSNKPGTTGTAQGHYNTAGNFTNVTIVNDQIALTQDVEAIALTIRRVSTGHFSIKLPCGKYYGFNSGTDMKLYDTEYSNNTIDFNALGYLGLSDVTTTDRFLSYSSRYGAIKYYAREIEDANLYLYERVAPRSVVYYTTNPLHETDCTHEHTTLTGAVDATCTEPGFTGNWVCDNCGNVITAGVATPALGHSFDSGVVTAPSAENDYVGYTTYTCTRCGYSYQDNFTGVDYQVTYSVLGTTTTATVNSYTGTTLPTTAAAADGYTFVGWSEQAIATESASATLLTGTYKPSANVTLYAVYSHVETVQSDSIYTLVGPNDVTAGTYLIGALRSAEATDDFYFADGSISNGNMVVTDSAVNAVEYDGVRSIALLPTGAVEFTFTGNNTGGFTIAPAGTTDFLGFTENASNKLAFGDYGTTLWKAVAKSSGTPLLTNGVYLSCTTATYMISENSANVDAIRGYNSTRQYRAIYLFRKGAGSVSTTYYTTDPNGSTQPTVCNHNFENNTCTICGERFRIRSATLSLNNQIDVVYICEIPTSFTNVALTVNGTTITEYQESSGYYYFFYTGVNPQCMGDNLSATLNGTYKGTAYTALKDTYSVRQYCVNRLKASNTSDELRALVTALLAYGTRAQAYMGYNTNAYVASGDDIVNPINTTFTELSGYTASFDGEADANTYWISVGLTLTNGVAMNYRFYAANTNGLSVTVELNGETKTFTASDFTAVDTNVYEITFDGINADEYADTVTAYFEQDDEQVGNSLLYSVNAYIQAKQNASPNKLKNLVRALSVYGTCVEAYKASLAS